MQAWGGTPTLLVDGFRSRVLPQPRACHYNDKGMATNFEAHPFDSLIGVQARLAYLHEQGKLDTSPGAVDGKRTRQTKEAVKSFQRSLGQRPNGIASSKLKHSLHEACLRVQGEDEADALEDAAPQEAPAEEIAGEAKPEATELAAVEDNEPGALRPGPTPPGTLAINPRVFFEDNGEAVRNAHIYCDSLHTPGFVVAEAFVTDAEGRLMRDGRPGFMMDDDEFFVYYSFRPLDNARLSKLKESECDRIQARERISLTRRVGDIPLLRLEALLPKSEPAQSYQLQLEGAEEKTFALEFKDGRAELVSEVADEDGPWRLLLGAQKGPLQALIADGALPPGDSRLPQLLPIRLEDEAKRPIRRRAVALQGAEGAELFATDAEGFLFGSERIDGVAASPGQDGQGKVRYLFGWVVERPPSLQRVLEGWLAAPKSCRLRALDGRSVPAEVELDKLTLPRWTTSFPEIELDAGAPLLRKPDALCLRLALPQPESAVEDLIAESLDPEVDLEVLAQAYARCHALPEKREAAARLQRRARLLKHDIARADLDEKALRHQRLHSLEVLFAELGGQEATPYRKERLQSWQLRSGQSFEWLAEDQATVGGEARFRSHGELLELAERLFDAVLEADGAFARLGLLKDQLWPAVQVAVLDARRPDGAGLPPFDVPREGLCLALSRVPAFWQEAVRQKVDYGARQFGEAMQGRLWATKRLDFEDGKGAHSLPPEHLRRAMFVGPQQMRLPAGVFFGLAGRVYLSAQHALCAWIHLGTLGPRLEQPVLSFLLAQAARGEGEHRLGPDENRLAEHLRGREDFTIQAGALAHKLGEASTGFLYDLESPEPRLVSIFDHLQLAFSQVAVRREDFPGLRDLFGSALGGKELEDLPKAVPFLGAEREAVLRPLWRAGGEHEAVLAELKAALQQRMPLLRAAEVPEVDYVPEVEGVEPSADRLALGFEFFEGLLPRGLLRLAEGLAHSQELQHSWLRPGEVVRADALHPGYARPSGACIRLLAARWAGSAKNQKFLVATAHELVDDWRRLQSGAGHARGLSLGGLSAARRALLPRILDAWWRVGCWLDVEPERELYRELLDATPSAEERKLIVRAAHRRFLLRTALASATQPEEAETPAAPKQKRLSWKERKRLQAAT